MREMDDKDLVETRSEAALELRLRSNPDGYESFFRFHSNGRCVRILAEHFALKRSIW